MRYSRLFTKTLKTISAGETSINAQLLMRGSFVFKNSAGVYSYLPLGWRVIENIKGIIREEMNAIEGFEIFMPALVDRKYLEATGRFDLDVGFDVRGKGDAKASFVLGWTHEEVLTSIAAHYVSSYKDLPFYAYQIQTKFRNEPRAKSGLLRGREFLMKDLYSFHTSQDDLFDYYGRVKAAYFNIFNRCGLDALYTVAAGGDFTMSNTHEFQVLAPVGEDTVLWCKKCLYAENAEISKLQKDSACPQCSSAVGQDSSIEVGNIFPLGTKYSEALGLKFKDASGDVHPVFMGSYGIGVSRLMATIVELHHDNKGIIWPESVAPHRVYLIVLADSGEVRQTAETLYGQLLDKGVSVFYDDRSDVSAGEKFADADLLGVPLRVTVSEKSLGAGGIELKRREATETKVVSVEEFLNHD